MSHTHFWVASIWLDKVQLIDGLILGLSSIFFQLLVPKNTKCFKSNYLAMISKVQSKSLTSSVPVRTIAERNEEDQRPF